MSSSNEVTLTLLTTGNTFTMDLNVKEIFINSSTQKAFSLLLTLGLFLLLHTLRN
jgi:hypothetical protein